ncbi:hypothetical protein JCM24511_09626 [Saitozyma sp. JCM 24511]|nr:hypothetical protein JCM24511_09626 [Saitozyma sp. JCM 24511]
MLPPPNPSGPSDPTPRTLPDGDSSILLPPPPGSFGPSGHGHGGHSGATGSGSGSGSGSGPGSGEAGRGLLWTQPQRIERGMFAGKVMRFCLEVVQEPVHGRRKTEKDRRPLAHVPILRLRARECWQSRARDGWQEDEVDIGAIEPTHLICAAELTSSVSSPGGTPVSRPSSPPQVSKDTIERFESTQSAPPALFAPSGSPVLARQRLLRELDGDAVMSEQSRSGGSSTPQSNASQEGRPGPGPSSLQHRASWATDAHYARGSLTIGDADMDPQPGGHPRFLWNAARRRARPLKEESRESSDESDGDGQRDSKRPRAGGQRNLYGNLHVSGVRAPAMEGGLGLWFLFTDLCVRYEGIYSLIFRCFDVTAADDPSTGFVQPLADCQSHQFRVYSPRNFPGLPKQTELSEHFARQGFKLNTRKVGVVTSRSLDFAVLA